MSIFFRNLRRRIYLDYASLTPIDQAVIREMRSYASTAYANPSSLYTEGVAAREALADGRARVARFIGAHAPEIVFTSGGTESNALAIRGVLRVAVRSGVTRPHVVISAIEHSSIMVTADALEREGCEVTRVGVDRRGVVSLDELKAAIRPDTTLVSVMVVNNETGTIQPIREIVRMVRRVRAVSTSEQYPLIHTDAAQAAITGNLDVEKLGVDLLTLDASKIYGPRGVGCLYVRRGTPIEPLMLGGGQEGGMRSGTENLPSIMGFARAADIMRYCLHEKGEARRLASMRQLMLDGLRRIDASIVVNGEGAETSPHILNVSIPGIDNEFFVLQLDADGVACSTKSSCLLIPSRWSGAMRGEGESYVLKAMGVDPLSSVRFSFGRWTTTRDIKRALRSIGRIVARRRVDC